MPEHDSQTDRGLASLAAALEGVLRGLLHAHQQMLRLIGRKRECIRTADIDGMTRICSQENQILQRVADLEKKRLRIAGDFTERIDSRRSSLLTISEIAEVLGEAEGSRLLALGAQVREVTLELKRESGIVRAAAEALSAHVAGIMQVVHGAMSRAGVYGRKGQVAVGSQVQSTLDLKS